MTFEQKSAGMRPVDTQGRALQAARAVGAKALRQVYVYCVEETRPRPARLEWDDGVRGGSEFREVTGEQATWAPCSHSTAMLPVGRGGI